MPVLVGCEQTLGREIAAHGQQAGLFRIGRRRKDRLDGQAIDGHVALLPLGARLDVLRRALLPLFGRERAQSQGVEARGELVGEGVVDETLRLRPARGPRSAATRR